jgi:nucleotide-binding universal stress UspA family protein
MPLERIVIAVDGSPAAREATRVGLEVAAGLGAHVTFVHGSDSLAEDLFDLNSRAAETREQLLSADPVLRDAAAAAEARGVAADVDLVGAAGAGELVPAVLGVAAAVGAGLVVVGSRGRGPLKSAVLGSVSLELLDAADVPVVVVHSPHAR